MLCHFILSFQLAHFTFCFVKINGVWYYAHLVIHTKECWWGILLTYYLSNMKLQSPKCFSRVPYNMSADVYCCNCFYFVKLMLFCIQTTLDKFFFSSFLVEIEKKNLHFLWPSAGQAKYKPFQYNKLQKQKMCVKQSLKLVTDMKKGVILLLVWMRVLLAKWVIASEGVITFWN